MTQATAEETPSTGPLLSPERLSRWLMLGGVATLFLAATATVDVGYTLRVSYVLFVLAAVFGWRLMLAGWRRLGPLLQLALAALVLVHLAATILGDTAELEGVTRAGATRVYATLFDLVLGIAVLLLVVGSWRGARAVAPLLAAVLVGVVWAGAYALYQWLAQHFGWPFDDVVNVQDSNAVSRGGFQGTGILGWERARGTFLEPHFLAAYVASLLPLALAGLVTGGARRLRLLAAAAVAAAAAALLVTSSFPLWALLVFTGCAGLALWAVAAGRPLRAGVLTAIVCALALLVPVVLLSPEVLSDVTGRSASEITETTRFRTDTWERALGIWSTRPILGFGPGQSSVRLTADVAGLEPGATAGLQSAQGLWAAALIDVGVLGLAAWIAFVVLALARAVTALQVGPLWLRVGALTAALTAVLSAQITGDRLDLWAWVLLGVAIALAAGHAGSAEAGEGDHETAESAEHGGERGVGAVAHRSGHGGK